MIDPAIEWIHQAIQQTSGKQILCADENHLGTASLSNDCNLQLFTNRYDIANQPLPNNVSVTLNDFDFSSIKNSSIDHFF